MTKGATMKLRISPEEAIVLSQFIDSLREQNLSTRQKEEKLIEYLNTHFSKCGTVAKGDFFIINNENLLID
jgi:hypothetical protein